MPAVAPIPPATPPAASPHLVGFVLLTVLLDMVGFGIIVPVLPRLIEEVGHVGLGRAAELGGWMFAAYALAQFLFAPLAGNLSDSIGRRPLLLVAIAGLGLDFVLCAVAPTLSWLFVARILTGICGSSWVIANACIADVTPPEGRARAFGWLGAAWGLGFIIGPAIGGILGEYGPRVPFWVAAGLSLLNLLYGLAVLPETLAPASRRRFRMARANPFGAFVVFRRQPGVLPLSLVLAGYFFATSIYPAIWPFWAMAKFGWSESLVGLTLAVFGLVSAGFQGLLTDRFTQRFGEVRGTEIGIVCAILALAAYGLAGGLVAVLIIALVHGPEGFIQPLITAMLTHRVPDDAQGALQGGLSALLNISMLAGTLFFAQVFGHFMDEGRGRQAPDVAWFIAAACLGAVYLAYRRLMRAGQGGA